MTSASIDTGIRLLRAVVSYAVRKTAESPLKSRLEAKFSRFRRLFSGCEHDEIVFDDVGDVYCKRCRKDLTS